MTVAQFRASPALVQQWKEMLETHALLKLVLFDVMKSAHPARYKVAGDTTGDISATRAAIELGTTRGYSRYGDTLEFLAVPERAASELPDSEYAESEQPET